MFERSEARCRVKQRWWRQACSPVSGADAATC
jgi:hypothetical protein